MKNDSQGAQRVVQNYHLEAESYMRQLHIWLGVGSAGGAIAIATLASNLPNPNHAFQYSLMSFWLFLAGVVASGFALFALAMRAESRSVHFASAHNREQFNEAIKGTPEVISSPQAIADRANATRNKMIERSKIEHERAEHAWAIQKRWQLFWAGSLTVSGAAFVGGFGWLLIQATFLGRSIVP